MLRKPRSPVARRSGPWVDGSRQGLVFQICWLPQGWVTDVGNQR